MEDRHDGKKSNFFGRRRGPRIRGVQSAALDTVYSGLGIPDTPEPVADIRDLFSRNVSEVRMEIGFGGGEHLIDHLSKRPDAAFIGVEPFVNGMAKFCAALQEGDRGRVRLFDDDAALLLDRLPDQCLSGLDLLYPDPWPKKRHWKRRFISDDNVARIARVLKPGSEFRFASDIEHYVAWTLTRVRRSPAFEWKAAAPEDWQQPYPGWPGTRYEQKALAAGRTPAYLTFIRRKA